MNMNIKRKIFFFSKKKTLKFNLEPRKENFSV